MSTKNKKSVAAQALLEMDAITSAIKEESKKSLNILLEDAVRNALREGCCDEEDEEKDENDYEVIDNETNDAEDTEQDDSNESSSSDVDEDVNGEEEDGTEGQMPQGGAAPMGPQEAPAEPQGVEMPQGQEGEGDEGLGEFEQYHVGNGAYDLTGENDPKKVAKAYKLMTDDDEVVIVKDGNTIQLKDNQAGTEYVIDLGDGEEDPSAEVENGEVETPEDGLNEIRDFSDIAGFPGDEEDDDESDIYGLDSIPNGEQPWDDEEDFEDEFNDIDSDEFDSDSLEGEPMNNLAFESRKPMKENKEVLFEVDLGYTDNYQDKDPIAGLSVNEPSKGTKSWHKGVPTGTQKPWAGETKSKSQPFGKKIDEEEQMGAPMDPNSLEGGAEAPVEEATNVGGFVQQNSTVGSHVPNTKGRKARNMRGAKTSGTADPRSTQTESRELAAIKKENKELKEAVIALRKNYNEAYMTNVNLGKITKLFLENTTSQAEKIDIVNRFSNEAKTVEQSKALYESINRELKKTNKSVSLNESSITANGTKSLNESSVYKSEDLLKTIDFMNRVLNC